MSLNRRRFLQLGSLASASLLVPQFLKAFEYRPEHSLPPLAGKKLVVIQLSGGNDGLNTVIPVRNDIYYSSRPGLAIAREEALSLGDDCGLHPSLSGIRSLYDEGYVSILNSVGYPEPNRSHFRSMDIWQSASSSSEILHTGWLGRYLDRQRTADAAACLEVDDTLSLALKGRERKGLAARNIDRLHQAASDPFFRQLATDHRKEHEEQLSSYLYKTLRETGSAAGYLYEQGRKAKPAAVYPDTDLGKRMKTIAALLLAGSSTGVYYVSHGSFDTHTGQKERQAKLLQQLDEAVAALVKDLRDAGLFRDVLIMTFSEFGRRVASNASNGTDHGTAGNMFLISGGLKKAGLYNELPSLSDLDDGDLRFQLDFRQVYATVLERWLEADARSVLGGQFKPLSFV